MSQPTLRSTLLSISLSLLSEFVKLSIKLLLELLYCWSSSIYVWEDDSAFSNELKLGISATLQIPVEMFREMASWTNAVVISGSIVEGMRDGIGILRLSIGACASLVCGTRVGITAGALDCRIDGTIFDAAGSTRACTVATGVGSKKGTTLSLAVGGKEGITFLGSAWPRLGSAGFGGVGGGIRTGGFASVPEAKWSRSWST